MKKNNQRKAFLAILLILFLTLTVFFVPKLFGQYEEGVGKLKEWSYQDQNGQEINFSLPNKLYQDNDGKIEIHTTLPDDFSAYDCICFFTVYQSVQVYVDDQLIYIFDNSNLDSFGEAATSVWNFVEIKSQDAAGKRLTLKMHTPYKDTNLHLTEVVYGDITDIHCWLEDNYGIYNFLDNIFIWVGILFILLAFIQNVEKHYRQYQLYAGLVFVLFSICLTTGTKTLPVYWMSNYTKEFLCFISLHLLSLPLTLYIRTRVRQRQKMVLWCDILACLELITTTILFLLHSFGILDLHYSVISALLLLFVTLITGLVFSIYYLAKDRDHSNPFSLVCLILITTILISECLQFYYLNTVPFDTGFFSRIGAVFVIALEAVQYIVYLIYQSKRREKVHEENQSLQIQLMTSQIRPHFIINTIGAIRALIKDDADKASDLLCEFSKYIRSNLEQKDYNKLIPFSEEMDYINTYLKLEKARYGDNIRVEYRIETINFRILPLTVQPFVENAVKHGLSPTQHDSTIWISTKETKTNFVIEIADNGIGFEMSDIDKMLHNKRSIGMKSAHMRLENEMNAKITIRSNTNPKKSGTLVRIELPKKERKKR